MSPLLRVSAERRPQEAAPRKAAADRRAQRQTSKRGDRGPPPGMGREGSRALWRRPKKCQPGCRTLRLPEGSVSSSQSSPPLPFPGKKEPGSPRRRGEPARRGPKRGAHLKGGARPGVHFEVVDMFLERGDFSRLGVPRFALRRPWGRRGATVGAWTPNSLGAISGFRGKPRFAIVPRGSPRPSTSPASLFILGT